MAKKSGKYSNKKRSEPGINLWWWLLAIPAWLGFMILEGRPQLQYIRDSLAYTVAVKTVISGVLIFLTFFRKKKQPKGAKILMIAYAVMPWLSMVILSDRLWLAILLLLMVVSIGYQIYLNLKHHKNSMLLMGTTTMLSVLPVMEMTESYVFSGSSWEFPFWPVSVAVMVLTTAAVTYLVVKGYWYLKDDRTSEKVCVCIIAAFFSFMLSEFCLWHINYILDTSEPVSYELTIVEKDLQTHSKGGTDYILVVSHKGQKMEMEVSQSEYYHYEVGDKLPVTFYEGFFGQPYYIAE